MKRTVRAMNENTLGAPQNLDHQQQLWLCLRTLEQLTAQCTHRDVQGRIASIATAVSALLKVMHGSHPPAMPPVVSFGRLPTHDWLAEIEESNGWPDCERLPWLEEVAKRMAAEWPNGPGGS